MPSFDEFYQQELAAEITEIESERTRYQGRKKSRVKFLMIVVTIASFILSGYADDLFDSFGLAVVTFLTLMVCGYLGVDWLVKQQLKKAGFGKLEQRFKSSVVSKILHFIDSGFSYDPYGSMSADELRKTQLFDIKRNTAVRVDDLVRGSWKGTEVTIANVWTRSQVKSNRPRRTDESYQGFNGLLVQTHYSAGTEAFIIPKSKFGSGMHSLSQLKFKKDEGMSSMEQKMHNLEVLSQGMNMDFTWSPQMSALAGDLKEYDLNPESDKAYKVFTRSDADFETITGNKKLQALLSDQFKDREANEKLASVGSFKLLDKELLDSSVRTTLTYALHSGSVWVLIPAMQEKFELTFDQPVTRYTAKKVYDDFRLALASLEPFLS